MTQDITKSWEQPVRIFGGRVFTGDEIDGNEHTFYRYRVPYKRFGIITAICQTAAYVEGGVTFPNFSQVSPLGNAAYWWNLFVGTRNVDGWQQQQNMISNLVNGALSWRDRIPIGGGQEFNFTGFFDPGSVDDAIEFGGFILGFHFPDYWAQYLFQQVAPGGFNFFNPLEGGQK